MPALLAWLSAAGLDDNGTGENVRRAEALAAALTPAQMEELGRSLEAPTAALAVFAQFVRAQQALEGAPATVKQVGGVWVRRPLPSSWWGVGAHGHSPCKLASSKVVFAARL